mmetsp:Transcript_43197/g.63521  ORF Transcript_43197/g.63521 Transcript_43197/m.63521 type:complete len:276 (+) Transcript_43197:1-828(+)
MATARAHRTLKELTELHAGARPLEFVRLKRDRADEGGSSQTGKNLKKGGAAQASPANTLRAVHISLGEVAQAAGSAYIEVGHAKLLCTVHGPRPDARAAHFSDQGRLVCQVKFAAFSGVSEDEVEKLSRELPMVIHPALEAAVQLSRFPKSLLEVHVLVLEEDGDVSSTAITGASLALADAGIEMFDLVAACSVARSAGAKTELHVDPTSAQVAATASGGSITVAMMPARGEITQLSHVGEWEPDQYEEAMDLGIEACKTLHTLMRQALIDSAQS